MYIFILLGIVIIGSLYLYASYKLKCAKRKIELDYIKANIEYNKELQKIYKQILDKVNEA